MRTRHKSGALEIRIIILLVSISIVCGIFMMMHKIIEPAIVEHNDNIIENNIFSGGFMFFPEERQHKITQIDFIDQIIPLWAFESFTCCSGCLFNNDPHAHRNDDISFQYNIQRSELLAYMSLK